ncbi:MAG TPA: YutD family protein [Lactobacillaceae bacterium]|jgi:uncharacterized protein YutD
MDKETLKARTEAQQIERQTAYEVRQEGTDVTVDGLALELVENSKDAFSTEKLALRYTPLLAQYDFWVGDISAEQLRLRGFYADDRASWPNQKISSVQDYLLEYANFGAPYFIIQNHTPRDLPKEREQKAKPKKNTAHTKQRKTREPEVKQKQAVSNGKQGRKRQFTVRQRED